MSTVCARQKAICCIYNGWVMLTIIAYYSIQIYWTQKWTSNKASYLYWTQKSQGWGQRAKYDAQDLYLCIWQGSLTPPQDHCQKKLIISHMTNIRDLKWTSNKASYLYWTQKPQKWGEWTKYDMHKICIVFVHMTRFAHTTPWLLPKKFNHQPLQI